MDVSPSALASHVCLSHARGADDVLQTCLTFQTGPNALSLKKIPFSFRRSLVSLWRNAVTRDGCCRNDVRAAEAADRRLLGVLLLTAGHMHKGIIN